MTGPLIIGIVGWKNSGKTTLTARLVTELTGRGFTVSTLKHAHHSFDIDQPGTDTTVHRLAGSHQVAIVSQNRWALMQELTQSQIEPSLSEMVAQMAPVDLILAEGWKNESHIKIEVQRPDAKDTTPLYANDQAIIAIVNPLRTDTPADIERFGADDIVSLADFVAAIIADHKTRTLS